MEIFENRETLNNSKIKEIKESQVNKLIIQDFNNSIKFNKAGEINLNKTTKNVEEKPTSRFCNKETAYCSNI